MSRNATLDHARLLAAIGIVWFHSGAPGSGIGYAALPFFIMLTVFLALQAAQKTEVAPYVRTRVKRLLLPFLVWSLIYGGLKVVDATSAGRPISSEFAWWMLGTGPALHLWFLPFAAVVTIALHPAGKMVRSLPPALCGMIAAAVATLGFLWLSQPPMPPRPFGQWLYGLPAVAAGLLLALSQGLGRPNSLRSLLVPSGVLICVSALAAFAGWAGAEQLLFASLCLVLCIALPTAPTPLSHAAAGYSLFVYLVHPIALSVIDRTTSLPRDGLLRAGLAIVLSLGSAILWSRLPHDRWRPSLAFLRRNA